ncbi:hypothetical protein CROQUDRAFT_94819 [Cronartium quercuum f. sp. fusiforme G11]|uniref:PH domain-containing protein n=1 Tax=Cronartium quercuum f. sp. fusiforme G11 TaxID=708437 RepID=A0A9P6NDE9_9BASI|nr:hypothetical protein CROQUDRAFT_94819 [Cronartium quercuum f. sp. fusiforme G11]
MSDYGSSPLHSPQPSNSRAPGRRKQSGPTNTHLPQSPSSSMRPSKSISSVPEPDRSSNQSRPTISKKATSIHDMDRVIALFRFPKFYHEGFILRRTVLLSDGQPPKQTDPQPTWAKFYVQIAGTTMSSWDAVEMELAAKEGRQVAPNYTNITDARVYLPEPDSAKAVIELKAPSPFIFFLNNAGRNKYVFSCSDRASLIAWVTAIRLAAWERSRLSEIYTGTFLATRPEASYPKEKSEGWLMVRLPGDTEWTRVWCTITDADLSGVGQSGSISYKDPKRSRRTSLFNLSSFSTNRLSTAAAVPSGIPEGDHEPTLVFAAKKGAKKIIGTMSSVQAVAAMYPESKALVDSSTMFKIEGLFRLSGPDGRPTDQAGAEGFILATPGEGTVSDMIGWLLGIMDTFRLYGRPTALNYSLTDPTSFYFGYPNESESDTLFLDRVTAEELDVKENSLFQIRLVFNSILAQHLQPLTSPLSNKSKSGPDTQRSSSPLKEKNRSAVEDEGVNITGSPPVLTRHELHDNEGPSSSASANYPESQPQSSISASVPSSSPSASATSPVTSPSISIPAKPAVKHDLEDFSSYLSQFDDSSEPAAPKPAPSRAESASKPPVSPPVSPLSPEIKQQPSSSSAPTPASNDTESLDDMLYAVKFYDDPPVPGPSVTTEKAEPEFLSGSPPSSSSKSSLPVITMTEAPRTSFPSSFAAGKKGAARIAAAQAAQAAGKAATHLPGKARSAGKGQTGKIKKTWDEDSEEDEDEDEDEEDEEDEDEDDEEDRPLSARARSPVERSPDRGPHSARNMMASFGQPNFAGQAHSYPQLSEDHGGRQSYYHNSDQTQAQGQGQFPNSSSRREIPAVLREQPEVIDTTGMKPAFSAHGLLSRVMQEKQEKSAKSMQEAAHWSGEPLLQVSHKPGPPQAGLLGAIASHERDRKRDGGMGAALTERVRERKLAEIRQREMEEFQRASMMSGLGVNNYMGFTMPPSTMLANPHHPLMYNNPSNLMNGGMLGSPNGINTYEQMMFYQAQQMQMQQAAMLAAQQAYMTSFSGYPGQGGMMGGSQSMLGMGGGGISPSMMGGGGLTSHLPHQSMYGPIPTYQQQGPSNFNSGTGMIGHSPNASHGGGGVNNNTHHYFGNSNTGNNNTNNGNSGPSPTHQ